MAEVYAFLADGSEEVECLAVADVLVRAGIKVTLVSISNNKEVTGSHGFTIVADTTPGTKRLSECRPLCDALVKANEEGRRLAAICAAPSVLGGLGILKGKTATCYPGFEGALAGANVTGDGVVTDGNVTTARGLGYALDLGLELTRLLLGEKTASHIKTAIQYDQI